MVVTIDPRMALDVFATPEGLVVRPDANPERVGKAALAWLRSARRIAEAEAFDGTDALGRSPERPEVPEQRSDHTDS